MKKIRVILADANESSRSGIRDLLESDNSIDVLAEAANAKEVIDKIKSMEPEVVVIDLNMPEMDGIETTRYITIHHPQVFVITISLHDDTASFRQAMLAGAKEYLVKPLSAAELNRSVKEVALLNRKCIKIKPAERISTGKVTPAVQGNKLISIFGTKGGVGKSVVCTNLAVAMAQKYKDRVGLVDLDIQFGDISVMMNINPRKTISELLQEGDEPEIELLRDYLYERHGVSILAAPNKPELAELVTPHGVHKTLQLFKGMYEFTFIDTPTYIDETTLTALEMSDLILLVISLDLPTIKNVKKGLDILRSLQFLPKTRLILNRSSGVAGIEPRDVERVLDMRIRAEVLSDGKLVVTSLNQGIPFIKMSPRAPISKSIVNILQLIENILL